MSTSVDIIKQPTVDIIGGEWMAISVVFTKALPTRCVVLKDQVHTPTAAEIFGLSLEEQGTRYPTRLSVANEPYRLTWLGLSKCQKYSVYCAQEFEQNIVTERVEFSTRCITKPPSLISSNHDSVEFEITFSHDGLARCVVLSDSTTFQPSAAIVINGSLAAEGEMPALALAHGGTSHTIIYKGLSRDQNYKLYCAQHDLITPGMGFDTFVATILPKVIWLSPRTIVIEVFFNQVSNSRCIATTNGQDKPSAMQIAHGVDAGFVSVPSSNLQTNSIHTIQGLQPMKLYDVYCSQGSAVASVSIETMVDTYKHIEVELANITGSSVQLRARYSNSSAFTCAIFKHGSTIVASASLFSTFSEGVVADTIVGGNVKEGILKNTKHLNLSPSTTYDAYCAQVGSLSSALTFRTNAIVENITLFCRAKMVLSFL